MLTSKKNVLKPLIASRDGVHLTAYLVNRGDLIDLKSQLRTVIDETYEWLCGVKTVDERKKFLEPLDSLLHDSRIFKQMKGNVGVFRNEESFRVLNVPVDVEQSCQVATTFHVKPLLRWIQADQEFLFIGLEKETAHIYFGSQESFKLIDVIVFTDSHYKADSTLFSLNEVIFKLTKSFKPKIFMAGEFTLIQKFLKDIKYKNIVKPPISNVFTVRDAASLCDIIRQTLRDQSKKSFENTIQEFKLAEEGHRLQKNIFQISKAVVAGKVRKLIVTDELSIFGKIDVQSGGLAIHPFDLDHEDDCILDDLAQIVLNQGGDVVVAKRDEIPSGRPILAILDDDIHHIEKTEYLKIRKPLDKFVGSLKIFVG